MVDKEKYNVINTSRLSIAPMMDWTDRHCRYFHRLLSRETLLYTEMVAAAALVRGRALHLLEHSPCEHPVALQLGGSEPGELAEATRIGADAGFSEINLNCGCPSNRVQSGTFGAVLMKHPKRAAECVAAMKGAGVSRITVKCRIGVDDQDPERALPEFLAAVSHAGCDQVVIHARKAWLRGLSPRENRTLPPLDYGLVMRVKEMFPQLPVSINGGIVSLKHARAMLAAGVDGVMVGRAAYHDPANILAVADRAIFDTGTESDPIAVAQAMVPYIEMHQFAGGRPQQVTRHMLGLFAGQAGAKEWRRTLSEGTGVIESASELIETALEWITRQRPVQ